MAIKEIFFILILIPLNLSATSYYIKNNGNDQASGRSDATAWRTVSKVNSMDFNAGDRILFQRGGVWYETLKPRCSGSPGNHIIFGAYATGNDPIITAGGELTEWDNSGNWTNEGSNRWSFYHRGNYRIRLWLDGYEAQEASKVSDVSSTYRFHAGDNKIWIYAASNPAGYYSGIEVSGTRHCALYLRGKEHITFQNLDFRGGGGAGYDCITLNSCNNITFDGCKIGRDAGCYGICAEYCYKLEVYNCTLDTGDTLRDYWDSQNTEDGIQLRNGCSYCLIHHNTFRNWGHTAFGLSKDEATSVMNNKIYSNYFTAPDIDYGRAFELEGTLNGSYSGNEFYNNYIYDLPTRNQICFPYIKVYNNVIDNIRGVTDYDHGNAGQGLGIQEYSGYRCVGMKIYNNVIVNCADQGIHIIGWDATGIRDNEIVNNIVSFNDSDNHYQLEVDDFTEVTKNSIRNNIFYSSSTNRIIRYRNAAYTVYNFNSKDEQNDCIHANIGSDPKFAGLKDFHITSDSPARGAGHMPALSSEDYEGNSWGGPCSIGAYEYITGDKTGTEESGILYWWSAIESDSTDAWHQLIIRFYNIVAKCYK